MRFVEDTKCVNAIVLGPFYYFCECVLIIYKQNNILAVRAYDDTYGLRGLTHIIPLIKFFENICRYQIHDISLNLNFVFVVSIALFKNKLWWLLIKNIKKEKKMKEEDESEEILWEKIE